MKQMIDLCAELQLSIIASCYVSGTVIVITGAGIETIEIPRPMGIAISDERIAIASNNRIIEYLWRDDGPYKVNRYYTTGPINVHEMSYESNGELIFVNTKNDCLSVCGYRDDHAMAWRPPYQADHGRHHLNGIGMRDGKPRYVSAFSDGSQPIQSAGAGVVFDIEHNAVAARGIDKPHSPRWHGGKIWICESGSQSVGTIDDGKYSALQTLPGFTRGLDFAGDRIFAGTSINKKTGHGSCSIAAIDPSTGIIDVKGDLGELGMKEIFSICAVPGTIALADLPSRA